VIVGDWFLRCITGSLSYYTSLLFVLFIRFMMMYYKMSGKPGNVREFDSCQGNVRDFTKSKGIVREKLPKTVFVSGIFASMQVVVVVVVV